MGGMNHNRLFQMAEMSSQMSFCFEEMSKILSGEDFEKKKLNSATGPERWKNGRRGGRGKMLALLDFFFFFLTYLHWIHALITEEKQNHFRELAAKDKVTCM